MSRNIKQKLAENGPPVLALVNGNKSKDIQDNELVKAVHDAKQEKTYITPGQEMGKKGGLITNSPAEIRFNELRLNDSSQFFLREDRIEKQKERRVHQREHMKDPL